MLVYLAGPMHLGYVDGLIQSIEVTAALWDKGHIAYSPYSMLFVNIRMSPGIPMPPGSPDYERFMEYDFTVIEEFCDAVFRLPGESAGADREVALARELEIPVYYSLDEVPECDAA